MMNEMNLRFAIIDVISHLLKIDITHNVVLHLSIHVDA